MKDTQSPGRRYNVAAKYLKAHPEWVGNNGRGLPNSLNSRSALKRALKEVGNSRRFIAAVMRRYDRGQLV